MDQLFYLQILEYKNLKNFLEKKYVVLTFIDTSYIKLEYSLNFIAFQDRKQSL